MSGCCAAGKVKKLVFAFVSLDAIPLEPWFRKARERRAGSRCSSWTRGCSSGASRPPPSACPSCRPAGLGTDLAELGGLRHVTSPYDDGEVLIAMPALKLDAALLHVNRADHRGNVQLLGPDVYYDEWFARASDRTYVSCEELVPAMEDAYPADAQASIVERCFISGVVEIPGGAHPSSMPRLWLGREAFKAYAGAAEGPGRLGAVASRFVGANEADYLPHTAAWRRCGLPPADILMSDISLAELCIMACAEAFRGNGEVVATGVGPVPRLAAGLAKATHTPELMMTDGEAYLVEQPVPLGPRAYDARKTAGYLPFSRFFDAAVGAGGVTPWLPRPRSTASADQPFPHGRHPCPAEDPDAGVRGFPGNTICHPNSFSFPAHSPRVFVGARSIWFRASATTRRGAWRAETIPTWTSGGSSPTCVMDFGGPIMR